MSMVHGDFTMEQLLKGKRAFIIEDNVANRSIMQLLLEQNGATVGFERWGLVAVEKLRKFAPVDIILLDLMFPNGITGYDVFKQIRESGYFPDTPIVAVSASESAVAIPKTQALGFAGFIAKPIEYDIFGKLVNQILEHETVWYAG